MLNTKKQIYDEVAARIQIIRHKLFEGAECRIAELKGLNDRLRASGMNYETRLAELRKRDIEYYEDIVKNYKKPIRMRPLDEWFDWDSFSRMGVDSYVSVFWKDIITQ